MQGLRRIAIHPKGALFFLHHDFRVGEDGPPRSIDEAVGVVGVVHPAPCMEYAYVPFVQSALVRVTVAVFAPASSGANVTVNVLVAEAAITAGKVIPPNVYKDELVPEITIPLTVSELVGLEF